MKKLFKHIVYFILVTLPITFTGCSEENQEIPEYKEEDKVESPVDKPVATVDTEMNQTIDAYLSSHYLWNDEYKGMKRNLNIPYVDSYDNFLQTTLMSMSTNTLDKKMNDAYGEYTLYSYVDRKEKKKSTRGVSAGVNHGIEKEDKIKSFGISNLAIVSFVDEQGGFTDHYGYVVQSVYPASTASTFGVERGTFIYEVNGKAIDKGNYMSVYLDLVAPTQNSVKLLAGNGTEEPKEITLTVTEIDPTPILMHTIIEEDNHKIGYLVYEAFDAAYDNELLDVLASFKTAGITDLVLDLRYNGGGHVISSKMLAGCLAGSFCKDKIFQYYRYNKSRMETVERTKKETGNAYDASAKYFYDNFVYDNYYGVNLDKYNLSQANLYILTSESTASSSELMMNSLKGIGVPFTTIGERTNGKNVGMEVKDFDKGNYSYELAPITFQYYNAQKETVPEKGLTADYTVSDWNDGYVNFGDNCEPMWAKALELITKKRSSVTSARSVSSVRVQPVSTALSSLKHQHPQGAVVYQSN